jgi:carbonic anhydrase
MKKKLAVIIGCFVFLAGNAYAGNAVHWGYSGHEGPEHWGELSEKYALCGSGKNQSPIDIANTIEANLETIQFDYTSSALDIINNGHAIQINYAAGSQITLEGNTYKLLQYHFHTPSENTIQGKYYPMEAHFVHADTDGNLAVIGVMFKEGKENSQIAKIWKHMPASSGKTYTDSSTKIKAMDLMPTDKGYYRFNGSLTTPPCLEGVKWMVMKDALEVSDAQVKKYNKAMHGDTNRSIQPTNARAVLR